MTDRTKHRAKKQRRPNAKDIPLARQHSRDKQRKRDKKRRLFTTLQFQVGLPPALTLILPSLLLRHAEAEENESSQSMSSPEFTEPQVAQHEHQTSTLTRPQELETQSSDTGNELAKDIGATTPSAKLVLHDYPVHAYTNYHLLTSTNVDRPAKVNTLSQAVSSNPQDMPSYHHGLHQDDQLLSAPDISNQFVKVKEDDQLLRGQLNATDKNANDTLNFSINKPVDGFTLNPDGSYIFDPTHHSYQELKEGEVQELTVPVTVVDSTGLVSRANFVIRVVGTNDLPNVTGQVTGYIQEDTHVDAYGLLTVAGQVRVDDVDHGESHTLAETVNGKFGTLTIDESGHWQYQVANHLTAIQQLSSKQQITETITIHTTDHTSQNIQIVIAGSDDNAVISGIDSGVVVEDLHVRNGSVKTHGDLSVVDADSGEAHFVSQLLVGKFGSLSIDANGLWSYEANNLQAAIQHLGKGEELHETFTVASADGTTHDIQIEIDGSNDLPVMAGQSHSVKEDGAIFQGHMVATDVDHDLLTYAISNPIDGLSFNPDGSYSFDPSHASYQHLAKGDTQVVSTTVTVTDTAGGTHREALQFTITGTNDLPAMTGQYQSVIEDGGLFQGHMVATDVDHDLLTYAISNPIDGLSFIPDGRYSFDPSHASYQHLAKGDTQVVSTTVTVTDTAGGTHREVLQFTITGTNDLPVMTGQSQSMTEDGAIFQGHMVATDVDHDLLTYAIANPIDGLSFNPDGSYSFDPSHASYQHLAKGDTQVVSTTVTVIDTAGGTHREVLQFTITGTNDLPVMTGQSQSVTEDGGLFQGHMVATDVDHDLLTYAISTPIDGLSFNPDGSYRFDPSHASYQHLAKGDTQVVSTTVTVTDTAGGTHREVLQFTITGTNDLPAMTGQSQSVTEDGTIFQGHMVATDVDHDLLTYAIANSIDGLSFNPDGSYSFDPSHASYQHLAKGDTQVVSTTVTVTDTAGGTHREVLQFTITGTNDLPAMTGQSQSVKEDGTIFQGQMVATDVDHDLLTYAIANPIDGLSFNPDGSYSFDPSHASYQHLAKGDTQVVSTTVTVTDTAGGTHREVLQFTITGTNDLPAMTGQSQSVKEDGAIYQGHMVATDVDHDLLTYAISTPIDGLSFNPDGSYSFDPSHASYQHLAKGDTQVVSTTVTVTDTAGGTHREVLQFTITGTNDLPAMTGQSQSVTEDGAVFQGHMVATDVDHDLLTYAISNPIDGLSFNPDGSYSFDPSHASYQHIGVGDIEVVKTQVMVTDAAGGQTQQELRFTVHGTNDLPQISSSVTLPSGDEDKPYVIQSSALLASASDIDINDLGKLTVAHLEVLKPDSTPAGTITDNHDGTFTFKPEANYNGRVLFYYQVKDAHGGVTLAHANSSINAMADNAQISYASIDKHQSGVTEDRGYIDTHDKLHFEGKLNIVDPDKGEAVFDINYGPQTYTGIGYDTKFGGHILLMRDGRYTYYIRDHQPLVQSLKEGEVITDQCTVRAKDGTTFTIEVNIHGTNDTPTLSAQTHTVDEDGQHLLGQMQGQDIDHGALLSYSIDHAVDGLTFHSDGRYSFDPSHTSYQHLKDGELATLNIPVTVQDEHGATATQSLTIHIRGTADAAVIGGVDKGDVHENQAGQDKSPDYAQPGIGVLGQDTLSTSGQLTITDPDSGEAMFDPNGGTYSYSGQYGHLLLHSDGRWNYSVAAGTHDWFLGTARTTVGTTIDKLGDGDTLTDTITIHSKDGTTHDIVITIHGDNDAPYVSSVVQLNSGKEDVVQTITATELLANSVDVDTNDTGLLMVTNLTVDHGSVIDNHDGTYRYTPELNYHGKVQFSYDVQDAHGGTTPTGAELDLASANDASVLTAGQALSSVTEDHLRSGTTDQLWSGWTNLDVTDVDDASQADIAYIEVNGVKHTVPADFAMNLTADHGYFSTTHSTDGHNKWSYTADNSSAEVQGLKTGQQLQDTMVLITKDGTRIPVVATINGQDDHVIIDTPDALTAAIGTAVEDIKTTIVGTLQAHDLDNGDQISFELASSSPSQVGSYGTFYVDRAGHWHYDLDATKVDSLRSGDGKAEVFDIVAISSDGSRATQKVEILIRGTDDAATITGQSTGSVTEDVHVQGDARHTVFTGGVLDAKDPDVGQSGFIQTMNAHALSDPYGGSLSIGRVGGWTYSVPNANLQHLAEGETQQVKYQVQTRGGDIHVITIDILGTNDNPTLAAQTQTVNEAGSLLNGTMQGSDVDHGATLTYSISHPVDGLTLHSDGSYEFDPKNAGYEHLSEGQIETLIVPVTVTDEHGANTTNNLKIIVTGTNDSPRVSNSVSLAPGKEDQTVVLQSHALLAYATDVDDLDRLNVTALTADHGHVVDNHDGTFTYTPDRNYNGLVRFDYKVTDHHGGSVLTHATLSLQPVNDLPAIQGDSSGSVIETGIDAHGGVVGNDSVQGTLSATDPDSGDMVIWHIAHQNGVYGSLTIDQHGQWQYQLNDVSGPVQQLVSGATVQDTFVVTATDKSGMPVSQTVTIDVQGSNDGARIDGHTTSSLSLGLTEDSMTTALNGHLQLLDVDRGQDQFVPLSQSVGKYGHLDLSANGDWTYTLDNQLAATNALYTGQVVTDHFVVHSPDGTASKSITINVHGHDDVPTLTVNEGEHANSLDLFAGIHGQSVSGIQYSTDGIHYSSTPPAGFTLDADGHTLHVDVSGSGYNHLTTGVKQSVFVSYQLQEGLGINQQTSSQHGLVEIIGTSDAPVLHRFSPRADQFSAPLKGNLLSGATDVDDGAHLVLTDIQYKEGSGYHTLLPGQSHHIAGVGTIQIEANGDYVFTPDSTFTGNVPSMWYRVTDTTDSQNIQTQSTLNISIDPNHTPTVSTLSARFNEDTDLAISTSDFGYSDSDSDPLHWITITQVPDTTQGHLIVDGKVVVNGNLIPASMLDRLIFRPVANYNGSATFSYTASDGHADSAEQHAQLTIIPVNDAPAIQLTAVTAVTGVVTQTDVDLGDTHRFGVVSPTGSYGTLTVDQNTGAYKYVPNGQLTGMKYNPQTAHYSGHDTFEVSVTDKLGATSSLFVTFDLDGTVTAPTVSGLPPTVATQVTSQPSVSHMAPRGVFVAQHLKNHVTIDLASSSDSGLSNSDNLTNVQTPEINGHTDIPFSLVKLYDGVQVVGSGYSDGQGRYQITVGTLAGGIHNLSARALAPSGGLPSISSALAVTIDTSSTASDDIASTTEDQSIPVSGNLLSNDADAELVTTVGDISGHYGVFHLNSDGSYSYALNNGLVAVQKLSPSSTPLVDSIQYTVEDHAGNQSHALLAINIHGQIDAPSLTATTETTHFAPKDASVTPRSYQTGQQQYTTVHAASTNALDTQGVLDLHKLSGASVTSSSDLGVDSASGQSAQLEVGESLVFELAGAARSAVVKLSSFRDHTAQTADTSITDDRAHWVAYDSSGHKVGEGYVYPNADANLNGRIVIHTAQPFSYIAVQAVDNTRDGFTGISRFTVESFEANLIQYDTKLNFHGVLVDSGSHEDLSYLVTGLDNHAQLNHGQRNADGSWTVTSAEANDLHVLHATDQTISVVGIATDGSQHESSAPVSLSITSSGMQYELVSGIHNGEIKEDASAPIMHQLAIDTNITGVHEFIAQTVTNHLGTFELKNNGQWLFTVNNAAVQSMNAADHKELHFTAQTNNGVERVITVTISGENDLAVYGGDVTATLKEDVDTSKHGVLSITDIDNDVSQFHWFAHDYIGQYGTLSIKGDGSWVYTIDPTKSDSLKEGQVVHDDFNNIGGLAGHQFERAASGISIQIEGSNDRPQISGVDAQSVTEDAALRLTTSGDLSITDVDSGEAHFTAASDIVGAAQDGSQSIGKLSIDDAGTWHYVADSSASVIQKLAIGELRLETFVVHTLDGTAHTVSVTIKGTNDAPTAMPSFSATNEDTDYHFSAADFKIQDLDGDSLHHITVTQIDHGTLWLHQKPITAGMQVLASELGNLVLTPEHNFSSMAGIQFIANDGHADSNKSFAFVGINAVNDPARFSGDSSGAVEEDISTSVAGTLSVSDPDGPTEFIAVTDIVGSNGYGHADVDIHGHWTYHLDPSTKVQQLSKGEVVSDVIQVQSKDGTTHDITITITGTNDQPTITEHHIAGKSRGNHHVVEDSSNTITGHFDVSDIDGDTTTITLDQAHLAQYGTVHMDSRTGVWSYDLNNNHPSVDALNDGDSLTDTFLVLVDDGKGGHVSKSVSVTIQGHTDPIVYAPPSISVSVDTHHGHHVSAATITTATILQYAQQIGAATSHGHHHGQTTYTAVSGNKEVEGYDSHDIVVVSGRLNEEAELKDGNDILFIGGRLTDKEIEGGSGRDTLILGAYNRFNRPHLSHDKVGPMEIESIENIILGDGTVLKGHLPAGFPSLTGEHYEYSTTISTQLNDPDETISSIQLAHLPTGLSVLVAGHEVHANRDGTYNIPQSGQFTLRSEHALTSNHVHFETMVTTHNSQTGQTLVTTEDINGNLHTTLNPPLPPPVANDEPSSDANQFDAPDLTIMAQLGLHSADSSSDKSTHDEVKSYLEKLGIADHDNTDVHSQSSLPDDIDVVLSQDDDALGTHEHVTTTHHEPSPSDTEHFHDDNTGHHQRDDDPTLPDDLNN